MPDVCFGNAITEFVGCALGLGKLLFGVHFEINIGQR